MNLVETARNLDKSAGLQPMKFSDTSHWVAQWYWRSSYTSMNGLEAAWISAAPFGRQDFVEARVFLASKGPYKGQWRAYVSTPDSIQSSNLKDTAVGTFSNHRDAMAAVNQFLRLNIDRLSYHGSMSMRSGMRR